MPRVSATRSSRSAPHRAIGVSPFGIDSITEQEAADLRDGYELLAAAEAALEPAHERRGFHLPPTAAPDAHALLDFGDVQLRVTRMVPFGEVTPPAQGAFGIVVRLGADRFLAVGRGFTISLQGPDAERRPILLNVEEHPRTPALGTGERPVLRHLNGDETASGTAWMHPALEQRQSQVFPIPMAVAHTGVSSCRIYWLD